jgi:hypothetical protein
MNPLSTPELAARRLREGRNRVRPVGLHELDGTEHPGIYAWFVDIDGAAHLARGLGLPVAEGLIYAGQAGAGTSRATLGSRLRGNHLDGDIYASTFRLTLASILRVQLELAPTGGGHMSRDGEARLTDWIRAHLALAAVAYDDRAGLDAFESAVLDCLDPPLNIAKRPPTPMRSRLTVLRRVFSKRATSSRPAVRAARTADRLSHPAGEGPTPEVLARELGLPDAKRVRALLRSQFPRPASELGSRWGTLSPEMERAVRRRFGVGEGGASGRG